MPSEPLRIWAPAAGRVEIVVGETRTAAAKELGGWWRGPSLADGTDYAISLDGGPARPDPRSRWQPDGVHGASRWISQTVEPTRFRPVPLRDAVIYELHIGTFSQAGTFAGAIPHLPHLVELGVTHVEIMPVAQFPGVHGWGYDGVDLFAAHAPYGGPHGLRDLIRACHAHELAVIVDVVHNHLGPEGAYLPESGPYKTSRHHTPWGDAINLDAEGSAEVRRFLIDSALAWLRDHGADGLRLDAIHSLFDTSDPHFVAQLTGEIRALGRALDRSFVVIGEYDDHDPRVLRDPEAGGWGLDAHWHDDFHHAVHVLVTGETSGYYRDFTDPDALAKLFEHGYILDGAYSQHRGATHGQPFGELSRDHLVAYVQSHDQVGNRATGERLHHLAGLDRAKLAAALLFVSPFVPMLFQGEEWAASTPFAYFADLQSPELRAAVREGRRREHAAAGWTSEPFDALDPATRDASVLVWAERTTGDHAEMLAWYRQLIAMRRAYPALRDPRAGTTRVRWLHGRDALVIDRAELALICNLSDRPLAVAEPGELVLASNASATTRELPPRSCVLVRNA